MPSLEALALLVGIQCSVSGGMAHLMASQNGGLTANRSYTNIFHDEREPRKRSLCPRGEGTPARGEGKLPPRLDPYRDAAAAAGLVEEGDAGEAFAVGVPEAAGDQLGCWNRGERAAIDEPQ